MQRRPISWILEFTSKLPNDEEKIKCLQQNNVEAIRHVLRFCFDPNIKWLLPEGEPPYNPTDQATANDFYTDAKKLYLFVEGGNSNLSQSRREYLFIQMLQEILPEDAKLLLAIKDKKMPYPGLTDKIVRKAFPGIY